MGIITLKIDDDLERELRRKAGSLHGAKRGSISQSVEEALRIWLEYGGRQQQEEIESTKRLYYAVKGKSMVAEASSLDLLSKKLKGLKMDPRDVIIESVPPPPVPRRMGLRTTKISR